MMTTLMNEINFRRVMQPQRIEKFRKQIEQEIDKLSGKAFDLNVDEDGDEIDAAQCSFIMDMAYDQRNRSNDRLDRLAEALHKIKDGTFGICEECEEEIPSKRLEICPDAQYCICCAELHEKEKKSYR